MIMDELAILLVICNDAVWDEADSYNSKVFWWTVSGRDIMIWMGEIIPLSVAPVGCSYEI